MGFFDALASFAPGITAASQGLTGALQGVQQRRKQERDDAMAMIQQMRQARLDQQQQLMNESLIQERNSQAQLRQSQLNSRRRAYEFLAGKDPEIAKAGYDENMPYDTMLKDFIDSERKTREFNQSQKGNFLAGKSLYANEPEYQGVAEPMAGVDYGDVNAGIKTRRQQKFTEDQNAIREANRDARLGRSLAQGLALAMKPTAGTQEAMLDVKPAYGMIDNLESTTNQFLKMPLAQRARALTPGIATPEHDALIGTMEAQKTVLIESIAKLGGLGVLQPSDIVFLKGLVGDATSPQAMLRSPGYTTSRFKAIRQYIQAKEQAIRTQYPGRFAPQAPTTPTTPTTPPAGGGGSAIDDEITRMINKHRPKS